ncbi:MAG: hypothetical protein GY915_00360 [bacterium]|nr:hypothetical protein [bacterium]
MNKFLRFSLVGFLCAFSSVASADPESNLQRELLDNLLDLDPNAFDVSREDAEKSLNRAELLKRINNVHNMIQGASKTLETGNLTEAKAYISELEKTVKQLQATVVTDTNQKAIRIEQLVAQAAESGMNPFGFGGGDATSVVGNSQSTGRHRVEEQDGTDTVMHVEKNEADEEDLERRRRLAAATNPEMPSEALNGNTQKELSIEILKKDSSTFYSETDGPQASPLAGFVMANKEELFDKAKERRISLEQSRLLSSVENSLKGLRSGLTLGIIDEESAMEILMNALNDFGITAQKFKKVEDFEEFLDTAGDFLERRYTKLEEDPDTVEIIPVTTSAPKFNGAPPPPGMGMPPPPSGSGATNLFIGKKKEERPKHVSISSWEKMEDFYEGYNKNDGLYPPCLWKASNDITEKAQTQNGKFGRPNSLHFNAAKSNYEKSVVLRTELLEMLSEGASGFETHKEEVYKIFRYFSSYSKNSKGRKSLVWPEKGMDSQEAYFKIVRKIYNQMSELRFNLSAAKKSFKPKTSSTAVVSTGPKKLITTADTTEAVDTLSKKVLVGNLRAFIKSSPEAFVEENYLATDSSKVQEIMISGVNGIMDNILSSLPSNITIDKPEFKMDLLKGFTRILMTEDALHDKDLVSPKKGGTTQKAKKVLREFKKFYSNKMRTIFSENSVLEMGSPFSPLGMSMVK